MPEFYTIVSTILLATTSVLFFVRWRLELMYNNKIQMQSDTNHVINLGSLGGYYYWDKQTNNEEFSTNLNVIFNLHKKASRFSNIAEYFGNDKKKLIILLENLKNSEEEEFLFEGKAKISGHVKYIKCFGSRIDSNSGDISGVLVWFYDITEYQEQIRNLSSQYSSLKNEVRDYSNILNSMPIPIWKRDENYNIQYCNLAYMNFLDEKKSDASGKIPELDTKLSELSKNTLKKQNVFEIEKHLIEKGERKLFYVYETHLKKEKETFGFAYDISEQDIIKKELERHISAHSDLLESSSSAMAIYGPDTKLKFYNNAFTKLWGLKDKWLETEPTYGEVLELFREQRKLPEQADFKSFRNSQMKMFKDLIEPFNEFFYLPDGRALRVIVIPHALGGLLFAYEDMTDRFAMERSYNTLIAVQQETLDNLREGIVVFGSDGTLKLHNPMYVEMWPDEIDLLDKKPQVIDLVNKSRHLFKYDNWEKFRESWMERPLTRKPLRKRSERKDGKVIEKLTIKLPDGDFMMSYHDVTDSIMVERSLRERNEALEEADKLKTEFLTNVSYELRTPLTSIMGFAEVLEGEYFGDLNIKQADYVKDIRISSKQLMELINDILDLASIEAGYMVLDLNNFDIYTMLDSVLHLFNERCRDEKIKIKIDSAKDVGKMLGDEKRIKQVLFNIIGNSIKFTEPGGKITIGAREAKKKGEIVIWVEDNGIGILEEEKEKVFERFFKTNAAISMKKFGTGLGLSVVKNIVELHGGRVELESEHGKGTKILCYFKRNNKKLLNKETSGN